MLERTQLWSTGGQRTQCGVVLVKAAVNPPSRPQGRPFQEAAPFQEAPNLRTKLLQGGKLRASGCCRWLSVLVELNSGEVVTTAGA